MTEKINKASQQLYGYSSKIGTHMPMTVSWKSKSLYQIVSGIQKNTSTMDANANNRFLPQPLKIYRKEIASKDFTNPIVPRTGVSIDEMNRPGGTITIHSYHTIIPTGLDKIVLDAQDSGATSNSTDHPGTCASFTSNGLCLSQETNARRRCRSGGMIKNNYSTSSQEYLHARNRTFQQNQFNYTVSGNRVAVPGTNATSQNVYRTQSEISSAIYDPSGSLSACTNMRHPFTNVYYKPNNSKFAQQGAVNSGSYLLRKKFDTITDNTVMYRKAYGNQVASAMGYGSAQGVYTYKDKIAFPVKKTPTFPSYIKDTAGMQKCRDTKIP